MKEKEVFSGAHVNKCLALLGNVAAAGCENTKRKTSSCSLFTLDFGTICVCLSHLHLHQHSKFYQGEETITRLTSTRWTCRDSTKLSDRHIHLPQRRFNTQLLLLLNKPELYFSGGKVGSNSWKCEREKRTREEMVGDFSCTAWSFLTTQWQCGTFPKSKVSFWLSYRLQTASVLHCASCEKALNFAVNSTKIITWKKAPFKIKLNSFQIIMKEEYKHAHRKSHGLLF